MDRGLRHPCIIHPKLEYASVAGMQRAHACGTRTSNQGIIHPKLEYASVAGMQRAHACGTRHPVCCDLKNEIRVERHI